MRVIRLRLRGRILFLSYDPWVFLLLHFWRRPVEVIEHNNVDRAESSVVYRVIYQLLPAHVTHLCFESYIAHHVATRYGKQTATIDFPRSKPGTHFAPVIGGRPFYFAPTVCEDVETVRAAAIQLHSRNYLLLLRAPVGREVEYENLSSNVRLLVEPLDYDALFAAAAGIAVLNEYHYRVSAVFFEALASGKPCLFRDCLFSREAAARYGESAIRILFSAERGDHETEHR